MTISDPADLALLVGLLRAHAEHLQEAAARPDLTEAGKSAYSDEIARTLALLERLEA